MSDERQYPLSTLENFAFMQAKFPSFHMTPDSLAALAAAINWALAEREHLIKRNALLRERPDLPIERIWANGELKRLQEMEQQMMARPAPSAVVYGVTIEHLKQYAKEDTIPQHRVQQVLQMAIERADVWVDESNTAWTVPTPYAYAMTCKALAQRHADLQIAYRGYDASVEEQLKLSRAVSDLTAKLEESLPKSADGKTKG